MGYNMTKFYCDKLSTRPSSGSFRETRNIFGHGVLFFPLNNLRNKNLFGNISVGFTSFRLKFCMCVPGVVTFELVIVIIIESHFSLQGYLKERADGLKLF